MMILKRGLGSKARWICSRQTSDKMRLIYLGDDVFEGFCERADQAGSGYQTMINQALREYLGKAPRPVAEATLRRVLREELRAAS